MPPRKNQNLSRDEASRLREIAVYHGYTAASGPHAGQGSAFALTLALIHGDVAAVSLDPDDRQAVARWLLEQADSAPAHLVELIRGLAHQLVYGLDEPEQSQAPASEGPVNTLEG